PHGADQALRARAHHLAGGAGAARSAAAPAEIGARAEALAGPGDDDGADVDIGPRIGQHLQQLLAHGVVHRVARVRPIERDPGDLVFQRVGDGFEGHGISWLADGGWLIAYGLRLMAYGLTAMAEF